MRENHTSTGCARTGCADVRFTRGYSPLPRRGRTAPGAALWSGAEGHAGSGCALDSEAMARYCLNCGYDVSATPDEEFGIGRCPESGRGRVPLPASRVGRAKRNPPLPRALSANRWVSLLTSLYPPYLLRSLAVAPGYCLNCAYDVSATPVEEFGIGCCPECGRGFEEGDPYSYSTRPKRGLSLWTVAALVGALHSAHSTHLT
jgi:hypothetical protein